ncbi:MAG TPA: hypothetical protein VHB51_03230 [Candidatus Saccharimonadales bacterium]|nr:hypothetical protein [Candidatus Saccharimonadales bacterium]
MTEFPKGIDILAVDTVMANDAYTRPNTVHLNGEPIPLCQRKEAKNKVVGAVAINGDCLPKNPNLICQPHSGEKLTDFHARAITALAPKNEPLLMTEFFTQNSELFRATMLASAQTGEIRRRVTADGTIEPLDGRTPNGIFGMEDESPSTEGALIPLNGMMALDMAISIALGADKTTHLAGPHMREYTRDPRRMAEVGRLLRQTLSSLGLTAASHCYEVVDITGLASLPSGSAHTSQHELLRQPPTEFVLTDHLNKPCGS